MLFDGLEGTNSTDVVSAGGHDGGTVVELDDAIDFSGSEVELD